MMEMTAMTLGMASICECTSTTCPVSFVKPYCNRALLQSPNVIGLFCQKEGEKRTREEIYCLWYVCMSLLSCIRVSFVSFICLYCLIYMSLLSHLYVSFVSFICLYCQVTIPTSEEGNMRWLRLVGSLKT